MSLNENLTNLSNGVLAPCFCDTWDVPQLTDMPTNLQLKYAVLILNRPVTQKEHFLINFWNNALIRMTVDGGTKQWDLYLNRIPADFQTAVKLPEMITGDFDSITSEVLEKYKKKGCEIIHTPDQNYTDFTKAIIELQKYCQMKKIVLDHVIAVGQSSGRLDQILGNIQTLHLVKEKQLLDPKTKVYLVTDDAVSWLLNPGQHLIKIPKETLLHKKAWCSLVPVGETCESVTTSGLKWNLNANSLRFGDLVSTSNTFDGSEEVLVKCSHTILWSMRIPSISGL